MKCQWKEITGFECEMEDNFSINGQSLGALNLSVKTLMGEMCLCEFHLNQAEKAGIGRAIEIDDCEVVG